MNCCVMSCCMSFTGFWRQKWTVFLEAAPVLIKGLHSNLMKVSVEPKRFLHFPATPLLRLTCRLLRCAKVQTPRKGYKVNPECFSSAPRSVGRLCATSPKRVSTLVTHTLRFCLNEKGSTHNSSLFCETILMRPLLSHYILQTSVPVVHSHLDF